jgi:hypothetical protein
MTSHLEEEEERGEVVVPSHPYEYHVFSLMP